MDGTMIHFACDFRACFHLVLFFAPFYAVSPSSRLEKGNEDNILAENKDLG